MAKRVERSPETKEDCAYDFAEAERVVNGMDRLRKQAVVTGIPEIVTMVDATYRLLLTSYYCILRYEMEKLTPADE
jgi:hypothetical protein